MKSKKRERANNQFLGGHGNPSLNLVSDEKWEPMNIIHYVAESGNVKAMKLLFLRLEKRNINPLI